MLILFLLLFLLLPSLTYGLPSTVVNSRDYASLSAAITAIGASQRTLGIGTASYPAGGNVTVPANVALKFEGPGTLACGTSTITINGPIVVADGSQINDSSCAAGEIVNNGPTPLTPQYFGCYGDGATNCTASLRLALATLATNRTFELACGTYLVDYETSSSVWVDISKAGTVLRGSGDCTVIKGSTGSLSEGESGTLLAITASNVTVENLKIDGNKSAFSALTTYSSRGFRVHGDAVNFTTFRNLTFIDLPGVLGAEAFGIMQSGTSPWAQKGLRVLNVSCRDVDATCVHVVGDYENNHGQYDFQVSDIYCNTFLVQCISVYGARDGIVSNVYATGGSRSGVNQEWSDFVTWTNIHTTRNGRGMSIYGFNQGLLVKNAIFEASNSNALERAEIVVSRGQWWEGQQTEGMGGSARFENVTVRPYTNQYAVWVNRNTSTEAISESGTFSLDASAGTITRSSGTWATALHPGMWVRLGGYTNALNNDAEVLLTAKTSTVLTYDMQRVYRRGRPFYIDGAGSNLTTESGGGDETVVDTLDATAQRIELHGPDVWQWTTRITDLGGSTAVTNKVGPYFYYSGFSVGHPLPFGPVRQWRETNMTKASYAESDSALRPNAVTLTSSTNGGNLAPLDLMGGAPGSGSNLGLKHLASITYRCAGAERWDLHFREGPNASTICAKPIQLCGTGLGNYWKTAQTIITNPGANACRPAVQLQEATSSTLYVDSVTVAPIIGEDTDPSRYDRKILYAEAILDLASPQTCGSFPCEFFGFLPGAIRALNVDVEVLSPPDGATKTIDIGTEASSSALVNDLDVSTAGDKTVCPSGCTGTFSDQGYSIASSSDDHNWRITYGSTSGYSTGKIRVGIWYTIGDVVP